jgi:hypothetical protein
MIDFSSTLEIHQGRSWPNYTFNHKFTICDQQDISTTVKEITLNFKNISNLELIYKKDLNETIVDNNKIIQDQILIIKRVYVDDILLDIDLIKENSQYWPNYHQTYLDYCLANNITIEQGPIMKLDFYQSGTWNFNFAENFWAWYAKIKLDRDTHYMDDDEIKLYISSSVTENMDLLEKLKGLLDVQH